MVCEINVSKVSRGIKACLKMSEHRVQSCPEVSKIILIIVHVECLEVPVLEISRGLLRCLEAS